MENKNSNSHPGLLLKKELEERGLKQSDFANEIQIRPSQFNEIINGKRTITADFALLLEAALGIPALFWLNYQAKYDLDKSRAKTKNPISAQLESWSKIRDCIPYSYLKKMDIITGDIVKDEAKIKEVYSVSNIAELLQTPATIKSSRYRKTETRAFNPVNVYAWLKLVEYNTKDQKVGTFNSKKKDELLSSLKAAFAGSNVLKKTQKILNEAGIKFIVQEKPEQAPIDGVAFWSNKNPVIGLTKRYNRLDNFAFTLFHELGHVFLHEDNIKAQELSVDLVDNLDDYSSNLRDKEEVQANEFASNNLIPQDAWKQYIEDHYEFSDTSIIRFAKQIDIHPAIVIGRLRFENPVLYRRRFRVSNEIN